MSQFSTLILLLLLIAFLLRIDFVFYIVYVCLGVYAWSRWYTPRALRSVKVTREFFDHAFWGESVSVIIKVTNANWLPLPWLHITESVAVELAAGKTLSQTVSLGPKETAEFKYEIKAGRRGYYRLGPLRMTISDLFGLTGDLQRELPAGHLTIYPRLLPLADLALPSRLPFGTIASRQPLFEDPARPFGVREFRSGDSLRQINWKVSAHARSLAVKTLEPAISLETAILLNLHANEYRRQNRATYCEWAIEVAASLAAHLVNRRQSVGLISNGIDPLFVPGDVAPLFDSSSGRLLMREAEHTAPPPGIPPRPGRHHLIKILERLARIEASDYLPFERWVVDACLKLSWGITLLVITPSGNERTCRTLHQLVRSGYNPLLIVVEPDYNFGQVRERARQLGFPAYQVSGKRELDRWTRRKVGTSG